MARPRNFDENQAVTAASTVFAENGYAATSIDDLVDVTNVQRASLYATFGSKYGIFIRALMDSFQQEHADLALTLLTIALIEISPNDTKMQNICQSLIKEHQVTASALGSVLLKRAKGKSKN